MNILHLLSQVELTGAEIHAGTLGAEQQRRGHAVWLMSDCWHSPTALPIVLTPVHRLRWWNRRAAQARLSAWLRMHAIDMVHAHSRAACKLAGPAARRAGCAFLSTVHGRQHQRHAQRRRNPYGPVVIAVCEHLRDHLSTDLDVPRGSVRVIRNGFS